MRENTIPEVINIINEAEHPVLLLMVTENCHELKPRIQDELETKILELNHPVSMYAVCMPEESLTFPRPVSPQLYYYLPKNQTPVFWRGNDMIPNLTNDIEVVERMMAEGISHEDARYTDTVKAQIVDTEAQFAEEAKKEFPPALEQARGFVKAMWATAKRGMHSLPVIVSAEEGGRRLEVCGGCPSFESSSNRCRECGCVMTIKTQLAVSTCPLNKW
jgi:hypothetical protein